MCGELEAPWGKDYEAGKSQFLPLVLWYFTMKTMDIFFWGGVVVTVPTSLVLGTSLLFQSKW